MEGLFLILIRQKTSFAHYHRSNLRNILNVLNRDRAGLYKKDSEIRLR